MRNFGSTQLSPSQKEVFQMIRLFALFADIVGDWLYAADSDKGRNGW